MDLIEELTTSADPGRLFALVGDLETYPDWLGLVVRSEPESGSPDAPRAWTVELRGRVGPFARSKRLRMVRVRCDPPHHARFERIEEDGRDHADWTLDVRVGELPDGAKLTMCLHYGGSRFAPVLAPLLREEIRRGRRRLQEVLEI